MKRNILFILFLSLLICIIGCGKKLAKKKTSSVAKKQIEKTSEPTKEEEILSAEEFSKSFSKPEYRNKKITTEKLPKKEELPYKINSIEKSAFANDDFKDKNAPSNSLAARLREKNSYFWLPKWHFIGQGEVYLPSAAISNDCSLLAILETVPHGVQEKKGTMLILINTYNWNIARIHYFKDKLLTKIFFISNKREVLVWEEAQLDVKHRQIHKINIASGKIESSSRDIADPLSGIAISAEGDKVFMATANESKIFYVFEVDNLEQKPTKRKCNIEEAFVATFNNRVTLFGKSKITTYKTNFPQKVREIPNPSGNIPDVAVFAGAEDKIAYSTYLKPVTINVGKQTKTLSKSAGRVIFYRQDINTLAFEEFMNRQITFVSMDDFSVITNLIPSRIKPKTQAGALLFSYLKHHDRYVLLDTQGTLCLYHKPGKKWRKQIIFSATKE